MNDQEKIAAIRLGRHIGRTGIAARRLLRDYFRNISGKAVRENEALIGRLKSKLTPAEAAVESARAELADIVARRAVPLPEVVGPRADALARANARAEKAKDVGRRLGRRKLARQREMDFLPKDKRISPSKDPVMKDIAERQERLTRVMPWLNRDVVEARAGVDEVRQGMKKLLESGFAAEEAAAGGRLSRATEALDELNRRISGASETSKNLRKARRSAIIGTSMTGAGGLGGLGAGSLLALDKPKAQEKKASHDPSMRKVAEVLALFVETMECRR